MKAVGADRQAVPDDEGDAENAQQKPCDLAPGELLIQQQRRKHCREDRIGADDQAAKAGGDALQADVSQAEKERVVGEAEHRKDQGVSQRKWPALAAQHSKSQNQDCGQQKSCNEQNERRAIGDADFSGNKGKAPEQAEQADIERQRIEGGARNRDGRRKRHGNSP